jgi:hypothetical protein
MEELSRWLAACDLVSPGWFGIAAGLAVLAILFPHRSRRGLALDLRHWAPRVRFKSRRLPLLAFLSVAVALLIAAGLAEPHQTVVPKVLIYGKPVVAVVDVSGSMGAKPKAYVAGAANSDRRNGYEKARDVFTDLIGRRPDVNFALLLYSTESYIARYFAYKNELFQDTIENKQEIEYISMGTRTADALERARLFLAQNVPSGDKAIVLISDINGDLQAMVAMAEEMERDTTAGIKVFVIVNTSDGETPVLPVHLEGVEMVEMNDKVGIDRIVQEISNLSSSPLRQETVTEQQSLIPVIALLTLGLVLIAVVLTETRLRKIP